MDKEVEISELQIGDEFKYVGFTYRLCNKYSTYSDAKMLATGKFEHFGNSCFVQPIKRCYNTIKELYEWAKENKVEDSPIVLDDRYDECTNIEPRIVHVEGTKLFEAFDEIHL